MGMGEEAAENVLAGYIGMEMSLVRVGVGQGRWVDKGQKPRVVLKKAKAPLDTVLAGDHNMHSVVAEEGSCNCPQDFEGEVRRLDGRAQEEDSKAPPRKVDSGSALAEDKVFV